ncbi:MAG: class II fructose-bisphosphate aldolase [Candidatus Paceibacterota bacterium]
MTYKETIADALKRGVAIGHFNISNIEGFWAVVNASKKLDLPVIIGVSEGERDWIGVKEVKALVDIVKSEGAKVFLNADHTYSFERVKEVVDAGYDSVIIDCAKLPFDENVAITKQCVEYARSVNPEILVEAEFGFIGSSSKILDALPEGAAQSESELTSPEQALDFVQKTGVDMFAPAVGNVHGMLRNSKDPHLHIERIKAISEAVKIPLVLHGGSGTPDEDFVKAAENGMAIIHISTELRFAFASALKEEFVKNPDEVAPYKLMKSARDAMQAQAEARLKLFNKIN